MSLAREEWMSLSDEVMTTGELADYLRVHPSTVYKLLRRRDLPAFKVGSDWRFRRAEIERWMRAQQPQHRHYVTRDSHARL
jgi:excisionase family DNA binding protein